MFGSAGAPQLGSSFRVDDLERVRSDRPLLGKLLDLANPVSVRMSGVNINGPPPARVEAAGFAIDSATWLEPGHIFTLIRGPRTDG